MKPTNILIVSNEVDALGGVSKFSATLSEALLDRGYDVTWLGVTPAHAPTDYGVSDGIQKVTAYAETPETYQFSFSDKIRYRKQIRSNSTRLAHSILRPQSLAKTKALLDRLGSETVIIVTQLFAMEYLIEAGLKWGLPEEPRVIGQYHDSFDSARNSSNLPRAKKFYPEVDKFLVLTETDSDLFEKSGFQNMGFIYNPVPREVLDPAPEKSNKVVSLGRYHQQKSLDHLIKAWSRLTDEFPHWTLELFGHGPLEEELQALIVELEVERTVTLRGLTDNPALELASSRIHAMTSQHEGLPLAIVEAGYQGVPTVAYDCAPGMSVLIDSESSGILSPLNDIDTFVENLRILMLDSELRERMGIEAEKASDRFSVARIVDEWESLIMELY